MKILNIHTRLINQPKSVVAELLSTLATDNDKVWPHEKWPAIRFKNGLKIGEKGGHGPVRYAVEKYESGKLIQFSFLKPDGFIGFHKLEINEITPEQTEIKHIIDMKTNLSASFIWLIGIRWMHDALIEDAFDKVENQFTTEKKRTKWNFWVRFLRTILS